MTKAENIFLQEFDTPYNTAPFDKITNADYEPAIKVGIEQQIAEIDAIVNQRSTPTFDNTIIALENSGETLDRVLNTFYPLLSAECDDQMMDISSRVIPILSEHSSNISLNEQLWERIKYLYNHRNELTLDTEDSMLLQKTYDGFARSGANLEGEARAEYRKLSSELSELTNKFGQNALKELNAYELWLSEDDLAGLPDSAIDAAKFAANAKGREGEYLITLAAPSYIPFMKFSSRADLRQKLYMAYNTRNTSGEFSNIDIIKRITEIRLELSNLLGSENYAQHSLKKQMAHNPESVYQLLNQLKDAYRPTLDAEIKELTQFASDYEGAAIALNAWDYSYYLEKLKNSKFNLSEEMLRPYFELNNVVDGVFSLATKLYGLQFSEQTDIALFHSDVKTYRVTDADGRYMGILYTDFFPRATKRSGAWMTGFREQYISEDGVNHRPHISITMNFTPATDSKPSLLTYAEVETLLHEFGHALHGLLADTKYASLSGTNVARDFVELPSQFNENFLSEREYLSTFAKDYITGEVIPDSLTEKITESAQFGAGYQTIRQLNFGLLDMAWHTITEPVTDAEAFERDAIAQVALFPHIDGCMISPQFSHIFAGGYAAGYYSYKWAEVLDADAYAVFKRNGLFDPATAKSFRDNILSKGGTVDPMELYIKFKGTEPTIDALLNRDGIKTNNK